jgi:hypothetical protein
MCRLSGVGRAGKKNSPALDAYQRTVQQKMHHAATAPARRRSDARNARFWNNTPIVKQGSKWYGVRQDRKGRQPDILPHLREMGNVPVWYIGASPSWRSCGYKCEQLDPVVLIGFIGIRTAEKSEDIRKLEHH